MTTLSTLTIDRIKDELRSGPKTSRQIAFATGISQPGVDSCLKCLWRRRETTRTVSRNSEPPVWRMIG